MLRRSLGKVALTMILVAFVVFSSFSVSAATIYGDANQDSFVDIKDLVRVKKHLADKTVSIYVEAVDNDENGQVDVTDMAKLRKVLLGTDQYEISTVEGNISWPEAWDQ